MRRAGAAAGCRNPLTLAVAAGLWIATLCNWPLWRALAALPEMDTTRGLVFMLGFGAMIAALSTALLAFAAWRYTIKPTIALFLVSAALGAHFMGSYGVVIDPTMMTNVLQTNPSETLDLMSLRLLLSLQPDAQPLPARSSAHSTARQVTTLNGPEGGLTPDEEAAARQAGFLPTAMGPRVLRADTAPLAALACLGWLA